MTTAKDAVCGMTVKTESARQKAEHQGQIYYFCSPGCRKAFESDPQKYVDPSYKPSM